MTGKRGRPPLVFDSEEARLEHFRGQRRAYQRTRRANRSPELRAKEITAQCARQAERYARDPEFRARQIAAVSRRQKERWATDPAFREAQRGRKRKWVYADKPKNN